MEQDRNEYGSSIACEIDCPAKRHAVKIKLVLDAQASARLLIRLRIKKRVVGIGVEPHGIFGLLSKLFFFRADCRLDGGLPTLRDLLERQGHSGIPNYMQIQGLRSFQQRSVHAWE